MTPNSQLASPLVVIAGETGSGKSSLALQLAQKFNGEIISADSWQVYKGFDIGTAKPTSAEQKLVKHYLIDIVDAKEGFNAVEYQRLAQAAIEDIVGRGKLPVMVGGTGLYIDSVLYDFGFLPSVEPNERARRNAQNIDELLAETKTVGINIAGIDIRNKRRIIRALEAAGERPSSKPLRPKTLIIGVQISRDVLRERITMRVNTMIEDGLEAEVARLAKKYSWEIEPMKGIGYHEWQVYFTGVQNLEETRQKIIKATMDLAKRQRTWFKRNNSIQWVDNPSEAIKITTEFLNKFQ